MPMETRDTDARYDLVHACRRVEKAVELVNLSNNPERYPEADAQVAILKHLLGADDPDETQVLLADGAPAPITGKDDAGKITAEGKLRVSEAKLKAVDISPAHVAYAGRPAGFTLDGNEMFHSTVVPNGLYGKLCVKMDPNDTWRMTNLRQGLILRSASQNTSCIVVPTASGAKVDGIKMSPEFPSMNKLEFLQNDVVYEIEGEWEYGVRMVSTSWGIAFERVRWDEGKHGRNHNKPE